MYPDDFNILSFWIVVVAVLAIWTWLRTRGLKSRIAVLERKLAAQAAAVATPVAAADPLATDVHETAAQKFLRRLDKVWSGATPEQAPAPEMAAPMVASGETVAGTTETVAEPAPLDASVPPPTETPAAAPSIEQRFAGRWLVWLGGIAVAIGGVLFVKYLVDNGLLSPLLRCLTGLAVGALLVVAGEWVRRLPSQRAATAVGPDYVPQALTAAGLLTAFASIYAAHHWYELIGPTVAFAGAAAIAFIAFGLALVEGPFVAALGLLGAYATPLLIPSGDPNALTFFPYIAIVCAASIGLLHRRPWGWLGHAAILGAIAWTAIWLHGGLFRPDDQLPIGIFLLALGCLSVFGIAGRGILRPEHGSLANMRTTTLAMRVAIVGIGSTGLGIAGLVNTASHSTLSLTLLAVATALAVLLAFSSANFGRLGRVAGLIAFITLMAWHNAAFLEPALDDRGYWVSILGPEAARFLKWTLSFGGGLMLAGLVGLRLRPEPLAWASLAAGAAVLFLFGAWVQVADLLPAEQWAALAFAAAAILVAMVWLCPRDREPQSMSHAQGLLFIGAAILTIFGLDRLLDGVWLTIAIAAIVPALALAGQAVQVPLLGPLASAVAALASIRLFVSRELFEDRRDLPLGPYWVVYGYGVPAVLFYLSSRLMRSRYWRSAMAIEGAALALAIALISLVLRVAIAGGVRSEELTLLEASAHIMAWLGAAYGLMHRLQGAPSVVRLWAARLLLAVSCLALLIVNLGGLNPVVTEDPAPGGIVFNGLLLAYLAPAILLGLIAYRLPAIRWQQALPAFGCLALLLVLAYVTLETKRVFQGPSMVLEWLSQGESYAYSAVWLATALAFLIAGIRLRNQPLRYAGLAFVMLTVAKVFLIDMSGLEGLYRIASFAGLGLCLVGIGYLYTRFLQVPPRAPAPAETV